MSSCETFAKRFHRVSFSKEGFTDCPVIFLEAWQATRPLVSGKPAGEYTPPSTHRLFYLAGPGECEKQSSWSQRRKFFRPTAFQRLSQYSRDLKRLAQTCAAFAQILIDRPILCGCPSGHCSRPDRCQQSRSGKRIDERV